MSLLLKALQTPPAEAVCIIDGEGEHLWGAVRARAQRGAKLLESMGRADRHGRRIGMLVERGADWMATFLAILEAGAIAVPLSPRYPDRALRQLLDDAQISALVCSPALQRPALTSWPQPTTAALLDDDGSSFKASAGPLANGSVRPNVADDSVALLLYTSGTTGTPKGVILSHRALLQQARELIASWQLDGLQALLHVLPLNHMHGLAIALLPCLLADMRVLMLGDFDAQRTWQALAKVDVFMAVPTIYHHLLEAFDHAPEAQQQVWRATARRLILTTSGSAALPSRVAGRWRTLHGGIPLERYGMTETGVICSNPRNPAERQERVVGPPLPSLELKLVDEDGQPAQRGEVWVRGPGLFDGYWKRASETASAFEGNWFKTGDIAEQRPDGAIRLLGRDSVDILKSAGYKISALEVEEQLREHPAIAEVAVVGVPDPIWGQRVGAAVVLASGQQLTSISLRAWSTERLAKHQLPRDVRFVTSLPRNALGKVVKRAVVLLFAQDPEAAEGGEPDNAT